MTELTPLSADQAFQIDFNFQQVPSALAIDIPPEAAAAMLHISADQFNAYVASAAANCASIAEKLLSNASHCAAVQRLKVAKNGAVSTVMTVGDSITTYRYGYAEILQALLKLVEPEKPVQFYNHGRSGYTSTHGLEHTYTQYLAQRPDWVFLKYGANDTKRFGKNPGKLLVSRDEYRANLSTIIDGFLSVGAQVIVMTPTPVVEPIVNNNPDFQTWLMGWDNRDIQACADGLHDITAARGVPLIDLCALFSLTPDPALYLPDGLHPGPAGHALIIEQVLNQISLV
jgi:lysophospholipase L1-like esterase